MDSHRYRGCSVRGGLHLDSSERDHSSMTEHETLLTGKRLPKRPKPPSDIWSCGCAVDADHTDECKRRRYEPLKIVAKFWAMIFLVWISIRVIQVLWHAF